MSETTKVDRDALVQPLARLESWFATMRAGCAYYGPSVGAKGWNAAYCGPGYDWRYEGILRAAALRYQTTKQQRYLDAIVEDVNAIVGAQWRCGCFSLSQFDNNPCEGGMPHESAMLLGVMHALPLLEQADRARAACALGCIEKYIHEYLTHELWNKNLRTFNNWPTSAFVSYGPYCVASAVELLMAYAAKTDLWAKLEPFILEAGRSIAAAQFTEGTLKGGIPASTADRENVYPHLAARCAPVLRALAERTQERAFREALERLHDFFKPYFSDLAECPRTIWMNRPACTFPRFTGATADTILHLLDGGVMDEGEAARQAAALCAHQLPSGAFRSAVGFSGRSQDADWRDFMPVCGWQDKIYALLARLCNVAGADDGTIATYEQDVRVLLRRARFSETEDAIMLKRADGALLFHWRKRTVWPLVCLL